MKLGMRLPGWKKMIVVEPAQYSMCFMSTESVLEQVRKGIRVQLGQAPQGKNLRKSSQGRSKR